MFNSTVSKIAKASLVVAVLMGASMGAHADGLMLTDLTRNIEQNISAQMQDMMQVAQHELSLSLQTHLAEAMFELEDSGKVSELVQLQSETGITSAMVKD
ncbi:hypothetical protein [Shewanella benthica]|uniref:Uncharacterized protein n=1 Tax=Shewanella benthica KT99 TaxID=314608 RepID=A9D189_9GAMM|nr:hypothetical protein [Shewanella benthica]EDQ01964.1 hypothetical protein KT99_08653 [Shewanella benthica KT99]